jgi:hypothetical protein
MGQSDGKFTIGLGYVSGFFVRGVCAIFVVRCGKIVTALLRSEGLVQAHDYFLILAGVLPERYQPGRISDRGTLGGSAVMALSAG